MNYLANITNWPFLNEPLYRWAIFALAMALIGLGWSNVIGYMK